jgi:hypothetical protein
MYVIHQWKILRCGINVHETTIKQNNKIQNLIYKGNNKTYEHQGVSPKQNAQSIINNFIKLKIHYRNVSVQWNNRDEYSF